MHKTRESIDAQQRETDKLSSFQQLQEKLHQAKEELAAINQKLTLTNEAKKHAQKHYQDLVITSEQYLKEMAQKFLELSEIMDSIIEIN